MGIKKSKKNHYLNKSSERRLNARRKRECEIRIKERKEQDNENRMMKKQDKKIGSIKDTFRMLSVKAFRTLPGISFQDSFWNKLL